MRYVVSCPKRARSLGLLGRSLPTTRLHPLSPIDPPLPSVKPATNQVFIKVVGDSTPEAGQLLKREGVRSVPAFHFWKNGKRVDSISGADPERLEEVIMQNI